MKFEDALKSIEVIPLKFTEVSKSWWVGEDMLGGSYEAIFDGQHWQATWRPRGAGLNSGGSKWESLPDCLRFMQGVHREKVLGQLRGRAGG